MEYLECKQESLSMWGQDVLVVYIGKFMSYRRHGGEKLPEGKENGYFDSLNLGMP